MTSLVSHSDKYESNSLLIMKRLDSATSFISWKKAILYGSSNSLIEARSRTGEGMEEAKRAFFLSTNFESELFLGYRRSNHFNM